MNTSKLLPKTRKLCPVCKSTNITLWVGGHFGKYYCKNCEYIGPLVLEEVTKKANKTRFKKFKKR